MKMLSMRLGQVVAIEEKLKMLVIEINEDL